MDAMICVHLSISARMSAISRFLAATIPVQSLNSASLRGASSSRTRVMLAASGSAEFSTSCSRSSASSMRSRCCLCRAILSPHARIALRLAATVACIPATFSRRESSFSVRLSSSRAICSASIPMRPSMPASSRATARSSSRSGARSAATCAMAWSTRSPPLKRLMISFFSRSDAERKSS